MDSTGRRMDCTGSDVASLTGGDPSNVERKKNTGGSPPTTPHTGINADIPPQLPVFVSNRFALNDTTVSIENGDVVTRSLSCSGNGSSPHGTANAAAYQPIMQGVEDLRFTYGVYTGSATLTPSRFYTATEVNALVNETINGVLLTPWQRVTAVRVCVLTRTLGGNTRIADDASSPRTYLDCAGTSKNQPKGDTITRHVEVFGLRNALKQYY
jgi:type IV pilus assembly protein PilW